VVRILGAELHFARFMDALPFFRKVSRKNLMTGIAVIYLSI
jgi:hypothetical protein